MSWLLNMILTSLCLSATAGASLGTMVEKVLEGANFVALNCKLAGTGVASTTAIMKNIVVIFVEASMEGGNVKVRYGGNVKV